MSQLSSDMQYMDLQRTPWWKYQLKRPALVYRHYRTLRQGHGHVAPGLTGAWYQLTIAWNLTRYVGRRR
jgi:hypothetical protein